MNIKIAVDSTHDLDRAVVEKYGFGVVPMPIVINGQTFKDGVDISAEDLFKAADSGAAHSTAAINILEYEELYKQWLEEYDAIVHIIQSSQISACYQNACLAAEGKLVFIVDSNNLSSSAGILAIEAAKLAESGLGAKEIFERIDKMKYHIETSFVIDTLKYLHKGGRCSGLAALGANLLKLKPCIEVTDGKMDVGKKYRGNFDKVILQYAADKLQGRDDIDPGRIFITYAPGTPQTVVDSVADAVRALGYFREILTSLAGCTISNHCGPVCLGLLYYRKQG